MAVYEISSGYTFSRTLIVYMGGTRGNPLGISKKLRERYLYAPRAKTKWGATPLGVCGSQIGIRSFTSSEGRTSRSSRFNGLSIFHSATFSVGSTYLIMRV
jgi:hypothetical protein